MFEPLEHVKAQKALTVDSLMLFSVLLPNVICSVMKTKPQKLSLITLYCSQKVRWAFSDGCGEKNMFCRVYVGNFVMHGCMLAIHPNDSFWKSQLSITCLIIIKYMSKPLISAEIPCSGNCS